MHGELRKVMSEWRTGEERANMWGAMSQEGGTAGAKALGWELGEQQGGEYGCRDRGQGG